MARRDVCSLLQGPRWLVVVGVVTVLVVSAGAFLVEKDSTYYLVLERDVDTMVTLRIGHETVFSEVIVVSEFPNTILEVRHPTSALDPIHVEAGDGLAASTRLLFPLDTQLAVSIYDDRIEFHPSMGPPGFA